MTRQIFLRAVACLALLFSGVVVKADNITDLPVKTIDGRNYYYYEVQPKETVFSITHRFSIPAEKLIEYNPAVRDGLKAYSTLYFPTDVFGANDNLTELSSTEYKTVTIQKGQSLFGLAREYDITVEDILAANPGLNASNYKAGEQINIPVKLLSENESAETPVVESPVEPSVEEHQPDFAANPAPLAGNKENEFQDTQSDKDNNTAEESGVTDSGSMEIDTLNVTLFLPLDMASATPSKTSQLYIEFYRGFLIGVKEKSKDGQPVKINVIDTSISDEEYAEVLNGEIVRETDLFIGPEKESRLVALAKKASETEAYIVSPFIIKEELPQTYPSIIQTNIPRAQMYSGAIDKFKEQYEDFTPVFISRIEGDADKSAFTDQLKADLRESKIPFKEIVFRGALIDEDLRNVDVGKNVVIIPSSGNRNEMLKFIEGTIAYRDSLVQIGRDLSLFGYPEWITMRGESLKKLKTIGTTIYSRYAGIGDGKSEKIRKEYQKWFGGDWQDVEPNQALMGYDIATFALDNLRKSEGDMFPSASERYNGIQSSFILGQPFEGAGYINEALYFVNFTPEGVKNEITVIPSVQELGK